jgi:hypothetical protein
MMLFQIPISLCEIFEHSDQNSRTIADGEAEGLRLEHSNSVHNVFVTSFDIKSDRYVIRGECLSASTVDLIHDFELILGSNHQLWKLKCACPAGEYGRCKHVLAALFSIDR